MEANRSSRERRKIQKSAAAEKEMKNRMDTGQREPSSHCLLAFLAFSLALALPARGQTIKGSRIACSPAGETRLSCGEWVTAGEILSRSPQKKARLFSSREGLSFLL